MNSLSPQRIAKPFFTTGTFVLMAFAAIGLSFGLARLINGLGAVTNLDNFYPWGIWIAIDVASGVALAAGGFTTAALVDIFGRHKFEPLLRPAILTAWLGYVMVGVGLTFDIGRYWNLWQPAIHWQGNSVLFEVAMCVMAYLTVLTVEMAPSILEGLKIEMRQDNPWSAFLLQFEKPIAHIYPAVRTVLPLFIVAGVVLSCMHQSALGTLMLIAPTKVSALWYTPFLPVMFLLSAMMVGLPMVIMEATIAGRSFDLEAETDLLGSCAKFIPWLIGIYALAKFGDMIMRWPQISFTQHPNATVAWAVEVGFGLLAPFVLFLLPSVRRSAGWLLSASILVVFGVLLNRINVYIVGYYPPFATQKYFPAIGEIALTVGLFSILILAYRFCVIFFPILSTHAPAAASEHLHAAEAVAHLKSGATVRPVLAWFFRSAAALFLLSFVVLYSLVHTEAIGESQKALRAVQFVRLPSQKTINTSTFTHAERPEAYRNLYMMNNQALNVRNDQYEPVRFTHRTHDVNSNGNCATCHHRNAASPTDRIGEDIAGMHAAIDVRINATPCISCHKDMKERQQQKCSQCHTSSNESDFPARIGLKGAYHRQCIGCHQTQPSTERAPTDCIGCHHALVPDHKPLLNIQDTLAPQDVTAKCLDCHRQTGQDILKTAHWRWQGRTSEIAGQEHSTHGGLRNTLDNYDISLIANPRMRDRFHIGDIHQASDWQDPARIDCLVCHDTTMTYRRQPEAQVADLKMIAEKAGRPSRFNCGSCHFYSGSGAENKHGDLSPALVNSEPDLDFHMGKVNMRCQDCHATSKHQIAGLSFNAPVVEARTRCESCHGRQPHQITGAISRHLDDHVNALACETCHIPQFAKKYPAQLSVDFSTAGQDRTNIHEPGGKPVQQFGKPVYDKRYGEQTWGQNIVPTYRWFDGFRQSYTIGDKIDAKQTVILNEPLGNKHNLKARIYPFRIHRAVQPYDVEQKILVAVKFEDQLWRDYDWKKAITEGMQAVGASFSGQYGFVKTEMYTSIHHEVSPAKQSLGCADCHAPENIACIRCHSNVGGLDQPDHTKRVYPAILHRFDFKALGYEGDPALTGGRFHIDLKNRLSPK